jgi:uncharacterized protein (TIGR00730 family)
MTTQFLKRKALGVFCGAAAGKSKVYEEMTIELGEYLAAEKIDLVYGGGNVGLMGILADTVMNNGGQVYGVIPGFLMEKELAHKKITELFVVDSMHERKSKIYDLSHAFLALPGGMGTLDEMCEVLTWAQLNRHNKKCGLYNGNGFYDSFLMQLELMDREGFLRSKLSENPHVIKNIYEISRLWN